MGIEGFRWLENCLSLWYFFQYLIVCNVPDMKLSEKVTHSPSHKKNSFTKKKNSRVRKIFPRCLIFVIKIRNYYSKVWNSWKLMTFFSFSHKFTCYVFHFFSLFTVLFFPATDFAMQSNSVLPNIFACTAERIIRQNSEKQHFEGERSGAGW